MVSELITKACSKCKYVKDLSQFYNDRKYKYGKGSLCKDCKRKESKERAKRKLESEEGKKLNRLRSKSYREREPEKYKWSVKQATYKKLGIKITKEEYDKMYVDQNGKCAICENPPTGFKKSLCLDHCHDSLKVRGLLCDNCNAGLGKFKDDIDILLKAVDYLKKHAK